MMKNRIISGFLALVMVISLFPATVFTVSAEETSAIISVDNVTVKPGKTVTVDLYIENNPGILGMTLKLNFDDSIATLTGVKKGVALEEMTFTAPRGEALKNGCALPWDAEKVEDENVRDGIIATLTFEISEQANAGDILNVCLSYDKGAIIDSDASAIDVSLVSGKIFVLDYTPGDVNDDDYINSTDCVYLRRYIAGGYNVTINTLAADVNDDGFINTTDVVLIRRFIAGGYGLKLNHVTVKCNHTTLTEVSAKEATCTQTGNIAYWICECGELFADEQGGKSINSADTVIGIKNHSLNHVAEKAPSCTEKGTESCWQCGKCKKFFSDELGENEIVAPKPISAAGHTFSSNWTYDETYHWHASTCGHTTEIKDKAEHNPKNNICAVCEYDGRLKLTAPTITKVTADKIYWSGDERATGYYIIVNGRYSETYGADVSSAKFEELYYGEKGIADIIDFGKTENHIKVKAICADGTYKDSEYGVYSGDAIYVPSEQGIDTTALLEKGIGKGYNLLGVEEFEIEKDENNNDRIVITEETLSGKYFNTAETKATVFKPEKLLKAYAFIVEDGENINNSDSEMIYASSFDEYAFKASLNAERSAGIKLFSIVNFGGESEIGISASFGKKDYSVYQAFTSVKKRRVYRLQTNGGLMTFNLHHLKHTLSEAFLAALEGDVSGYDFQNNTELAKYIYDTFGTHVILGVETGGRYLAVLDTSTSNVDVAADLRAKLDLEGGGTICDIVGLQLGTGMEINAAGSYKNETTTSTFKTIFFGGDVGSITDPKALQDAIRDWEASVNAGSEVALGISSDNAECPAVSIEDLIRVSGYGDLADAFKELLIGVSESAYNKLAEQYNSNNIRLLKTPYVDSEGKNVLEIDLSGYQKSGSLENAYDPNLINGELNVFPVMFNKYIDKIVIIGALDEANAKLIDNFSVVLSKEWSRPLEIEIKNLGAMAASDYGIVDMQNLPASVNPVVKYTGINIIGNTNGTYNYFVQNSTEDYKFAFKLNDGETLDISTARIESDKLYLPVIKKDLHTFAGWIDGSGNNVAKQSGEYITEYYVTADITTIYPVLNLSTFKIDINNNGATGTAGCLTEFYWQYGVGPFRDSACTQSLTDVPITVPSRTGYIFDGYWLKNDDVYTSRAVKSDGIISPEYAFDGNTIIYAKWEPKIIKISLKDEQFNIANYTLYEKYGVGFYSDAACTKSVSDIGNFEKTGYGFQGYKDGNTTVINADGTIAVKNTYFSDNSKDITLNAIWKAGEYTVTLNSTLEGAVGQYTSGTAQVGVRYGSSVSPATVTVPARDGYTFEGYYASVSNNGTVNAKGETKYIDRNGICQESIKTLQGGTIYALWKPIPYTVSWNTIANVTIVVKRTSSKADASSIGTLSSGATVYYGDELSVTYTASAGYSISKNSDTITVKGNVESNSIKITPTPNTYTVTYNANGGSVTPSSKTVTYKSTYGSLPTPTRAYCSFDGWYIGNTKVDCSTVVSKAEDHTLTAKWSPYTTGSWSSGSREVLITLDGYTEYWQTGLNREALRAAGYTQVKLNIVMNGIYQQFEYIKADWWFEIYDRFGAQAYASGNLGAWATTGWERRTYECTVSIDAIRDDGTLRVWYDHSEGGRPILDAGYDNFYLGTVELTTTAK